MTSTAYALTAAAALTIGATMLGGCNHTHSQVTWQDDNTPRHVHQQQDWWNYQFVYFPVAQVYYEPYSETYYWFQDGLWREGNELPSHIKLQHETPHVVKLESRYPYMQHHTVTRSFAMNFQPYPGSDFTTSPEAFASYMDRYNAATQDSQWAQGEYSQYFATPFGSPFQPFRMPSSASVAAATSGTNDNADTSTTNDSATIADSFAEAHSDAPDF